jgi:transcriptional regulator with XRE-family HTH domain
MKQRKDNVIARRADANDAAVGQRVRARRLEQGLSQTELATAIGITFQQVQKYEKGTNRIGAGRLQKIAETLEMPVSFFFGQVTPKGAHDDVLTRLGQSRDGIRLATAFVAIENRRMRASIVENAEAAAAA